ncbi:MAG: response regulator [Nakamurella sp.]
MAAEQNAKANRGAVINLGWQAADRHAADPWPPAVLIVDDNAAKRLALSAVLTPLGYTIVEANSGEAALRCLVAQDFAVILLDVRMPAMDGFETAALIRLRQQSEMTPIIFVTSHRVDEIWVEKYYKDGAVDFLFAPIQPAELRAKVSFFVDMFVKAELLADKAREVQASADQLRLLTDAAPIGIFQTDVDNNYLYTNPRWSQSFGRSCGRARPGQYPSSGSTVRNSAGSTRGCGPASGRFLPLQHRTPRFLPQDRTDRRQTDH